MTDLTREVWINRCAARFASQASISIEEAIPLAEICLDDICEGDLTESPEEILTLLAGLEIKEPNQEKEG